MCIDAPIDFLISTISWGDQEINMFMHPDEYYCINASSCHFHQHFHPHGTVANLYQCISILFSSTIMYPFISTFIVNASPTSVECYNFNASILLYPCIWKGVLESQNTFDKTI